MKTVKKRKSVEKLSFQRLKHLCCAFTCRRWKDEPFSFLSAQIFLAEPSIRVISVTARLYNGFKMLNWLENLTQWLTCDNGTGRAGRWATVSVLCQALLCGCWFQDHRDTNHSRVRGVKKITKKRDKSLCITSLQKELHAAWRKHVPALSHLPKGEIKLGWVQEGELCQR